MAYTDEVLADGPWLYWRLGEAYGSTTTADSSGNNRTGTVITQTAGTGFGASSFLANQPTNTAFTLASPGTAVYGTGNLSSVFATNTASIEAWVYRTGTSASVGRVFGKAGLSFFFDSTGTKIQFGAFFNGSNGSNLADPNILPLNTPCHIVGTATFSGGNMVQRLYINGTEVANKTTAATSFGTSNTTAAILVQGSTTTAAPTTYTLGATNAIVDDVAIYASALSAARVLAHYNAGIAPAFIAPSNTAAPTLSGTAQTGQTLSTTNGSWSGDAPITYSYAWEESANGSTGWSAVSGQTSSSIVIPSGSASKHLRSAVTATNAGGNATAYSSASSQITELPVVSTPTFSGTQQVGQMLTGSASSTAGFPSPSISWAWQRSTNSGSTWSNIASATSSTYTLQTADAGHLVRVQATATNTEGTDTKSSAASSAITELPVVSLPTISGTQQVGQSLSVSASSTAGFPSPTLSYQWQGSTDGGSTWSNIASATSSTYTLQPADAGNKVRVQATATNSEGTDTKSSTATAAITELPTMGAVTVSGAAEVGETLTASGSATTGYPSPSISWTWQRFTGATWQTISGETSDTYSPTSTDAGLTLRAQGTATNSEGADTASSSATSAVLWDPANTVQPTLDYTGNLEVGTTLFIDNTGTWTGYPEPDSFSFEWEVSDDGSTGWSTISGEDGDSLLLISSFTSKYIRAKVSTLTDAGSASAYTTSTAYIAEDPANITAPDITCSGVIVETGETLTAEAGTWSGFPNPDFSYQWQSSEDGSTNFINLSGQTTDTLSLDPSLSGLFIRCQVTGTNDVGEATAGSNVLGPVLEEPYNISPPEIGGDAEVGGTLTLDGGTWGGYEEPELTITWLTSIDGATGWLEVSGETSSSLELTEEYLTLYLKAYVQASNGAGTSAAYSINVVGPIDYALEAPVFTTDPSISGIAAVAEELSADPGVATGYPAPDLGIVWERSEDGITWEEIAGETGLFYTPVQADAGLYLRVVSTAVNSEGQDSANSESVGPITLAPVLLTSPELSGVAVSGQQLDTTLGDWAGYPEPSLAVQWQSGDGVLWNDIAGETGLFLILTEELVATYIRAEITATNDEGQEVVYTDQSDEVLLVPYATEDPAISGTEVQGYELSATPGTWEAYPQETLSYQWQRSTNGGSTWSNIASATELTYELTEEDVGATVRIAVSALNSAGVATQTSEPTGQISAGLSAPSFSQDPQLQGAGQAGQAITSSLAPGSVSGNPAPVLTYSWQSSTDEEGPWTAIAGATAATFTPDAELVGFYLRVVYTASNSEGSDTATSSVIGPVLPPVSPGSQVLPVCNARLLQITGGKSIGVPYDSEFAPQTAEVAHIRWSGDADALVKTKTTYSVGSGRADRYAETTVLVPYLAEIEEGCTITLLYEGQESEWKISSIDDIRLDPGLPEAIRCYVVKV